MEGEKLEVGKVTHYFSKISVAVIELCAPLSVGNVIYFKGNTTDFQQTVETMQIEHKDVQRAETGQAIGIKVTEKVREGDIVYK
jgi:translation initiation factor IF-2